MDGSDVGLNDTANVHRIDTAEEPRRRNLETAEAIKRIDSMDFHPQRIFWAISMF